MDLFVYGTLTAPELVRTLTGRSFEGEPARLHGFRRFAIPGSYPYILPSPGDSVEGSLLRGLGADDLRAIDRYEGEGDLYFRIDVVAETAAGQSPCATYVANGAALDRLRIA
jgi:gamma-glutamylcyclotransferase (GGCT)/AIG2-like uncharacterized protein YtfP